MLIGAGTPTDYALDNRAMSDTTTQPKTVTQRIDTIGELAIGDQIVFERRELTDDGIERKKPLTVVDGATRTVESTHDDPDHGFKAFVTEQHAVEVSGDWEGAATYVLADAVNNLDGSHAGIVDYDSGIKVEVARIGEEQTTTDADGGREVAA